MTIFHLLSSESKSHFSCSMLRSETENKKIKHSICSTYNRSGCYRGKWTIVPAGRGSRETCGYHIKQPEHVGNGSVWVVVRIMGTYYHKPFMPSVSEGLVRRRLEHWIFKRVAFFPTISLYWSRTRRPWRHGRNWRLNTTSELLLWSAW